MFRIIQCLLCLFSTQLFAAEIEVVLSGNSYDGISKTPAGDFLVATADEGGVIRFDDQGNASTIFSGEGYVISAFEDRDQNIYISNPGSNLIIKDYFNGPVVDFETQLTRVNQPGIVIEAPNDNLYVGSLDSGTITEILKVGPFASIVLTDGDLSNSRYLTTDEQNNLYIANTETAEVYKMDTQKNLSLFATLPITEGAMKIGHLLYQDQMIYVAGFADQKIYGLDLQGNINVMAGPGARGDAGNFLFDGPLGLASGSKAYEIYVSNYAGRVVNRVQLDPPLAPQMIVNSSGLSGLWFDPTLDGEGYNLIKTESGLLLYYYGSNADGERLWLISEVLTEELMFNQNFSLNLFEATDGSFNMPVASSQSLALWGTIELNFTNCTNAVFSLSGLDGDKVANVQLLSQIEDTTCL